MPPDLGPTAPLTEGVLIRAENGDVVTFDETGLTLRLSNTVLADLRARLATDLDPAAVLGDVDAWDLRVQGGWHHFTARLEPGQGPRPYRRALAGGDIMADAPGPLLGLFSIGGARRAGFNAGPPAFRFNVVAPGDDIGAVGYEGTDQAQPTALMQHAPHATRDTMIADVLLGWREGARQGRPLFLARTETDGAARVADLSGGQAWGNFTAALDSLVLAARSLGRPARLLSVGLDFGLEDIATPPADLAAGLRALMEQMTRACAQRGLQPPVFVATFEAGTPDCTTHSAILAHADLALMHRPHLFAFSAPGYMFDQTRFGRPSDTARLRMAEMDAHAIVALTARAPWSCPHFLLAEVSGTELRVTADAMGPLVIDPTDPFGAGPGCGFGLAGTGANIASVAIAGDDARALILTLDAPPEGPAPELRYAFGAAPRAGAFPANCGNLRDDWSARSDHGPDLHRWALPCALPIRRGV